jgi:hypothetical protein
MCIVESNEDNSMRRFLISKKFGMSTPKIWPPPQKIPENVQSRAFAELSMIMISHFGLVHWLWRKKRCKIQVHCHLALLNYEQWPVNDVENIIEILLDFEISQPSQLFHSCQMQHPLAMNLSPHNWMVQVPMSSAHLTSLNED